MSLAKTLPAAVLETILTRLAALFLTGAAGDITAARQAAAQMLAAYHPQTEDELRLAANTIGFSFHALEALGQAAAPDMPLTKILRLRGSAVSLSRESHKAQRRLDQLQNARRAGIPAATQPEPAQPEPKIEKALDLIEDTRTVSRRRQDPGPDLDPSLRAAPARHPHRRQPEASRSPRRRASQHRRARHHLRPPSRCPGRLIYNPAR